MAVSFDSATVKISLSAAAVKPNLFIDRDVAICHLTNGFTNRDNIAQAFTATGEVAVSGPASEVRTYTVNFIQFQKVRNLSMVYSAGLFVSPERILLDPGSSPALTINPALDSEPRSTPFVNSDPLILASGKATNIMGDHPASRRPISIPHRSDGRRNMITSITDSREFWTSFVVRPPAGALQYLAHFHWEVNYNFSLEWELADTGEMRLKFLFNQSSFKFDAPMRGPPTAGEIVGMLANPGPPQANDVTRAALAAAVMGGPPNRIDRDF